MEDHDFIDKAKSHLGGTVAPDAAKPTPDNLPRVRVRETVLVSFESEDHTKGAFVLLDRTTGNFIGGWSHDAGGVGGRIA